MDRNNLFSKGGILVTSIILVLGSFFLGTYVGQSHAAVDSAYNIQNKDLGKPDSVDFSPFWKAWNIINEKYVATHGTSTATTTDQEKVYGAIQGMVASLGDPYTVFFPPEESQQFEDQITGNFEGVGMEVGIKDNVLTVIAPIKGSPSEKAGILAGDKILKIDSTLTSGISVDEATKLIRGAKGTQVTLTLQRGDGQPYELKVTRDVINIPTINSYKRADGVFVIQLYTFTADSPALFRNALRQFMLSNSNKLILDLRGNPGGYLDAAVDMASWFLPEGKVIVRESFGNGQPEQDSISKGYNIFNSNLKFAILIDKGSASASEILSGALHEYGKAILVGTTSFGKGSVQELINLTPDTSLKVTVARWLTPNGISISNNGITPDYNVPLTDDDIKAGRDPQMDKAAELLNQ
jgi:carboxyl-terminal processing protease